MFYTGVLTLLFTLRCIITGIRIPKITNPPLNVGKIILSNKKGEHFQRNWSFRRISNGQLFVKTVEWNFFTKMVMNWQHINLP